MKERAAAHDISLDLYLDDDLPRIRVDERKLKQILINLLSNAVKFTPDGGRVTICAVVDEAKEFIISIADTGIGIEPEFMPKLYEPFAQAESGLDRKYEGVGLGLSLTKAMVELHGGVMGVESRLGVGTTVTIRLPPERVAA